VDRGELGAIGGEREDRPVHPLTQICRADVGPAAPFSTPSPSGLRRPARQNRAHGGPEPGTPLAEVRARWRGFVVAFFLMLALLGLAA
jgi:hypothetical protein